MSRPSFDSGWPFLLDRRDMARIMPGQVRALRELLAFERGRCLPGDPLELLDSIGLSERQLQRAGQCLKEGRGFWDRIDNRALLLLSEVRAAGEGRPAEAPDALGLVVLEGVPQDVGPAEAERLLVLAQEVLLSRARSEKARLMTTFEGEIPGYLAAVSRAEDSSRNLVLRLGFRPGPEAGLGPESCARAVQQLSEKSGGLLPISYMEPVGIGPASVWFMLPANVLPALERLRSVILASKKGLVLRGESGGNLRLCSFMVSWLEDASWVSALALGLGSAVMSPRVLEEMGQILGTGICQGHAQMDEPAPWWRGSGRSGPGSFAALFHAAGSELRQEGGLEEKLSALAAGLGDRFASLSINLKPVGPENFLLTGTLPVGLRRSKEFSALADEIKRYSASVFSGPLSAGFAPRFQRFVTCDNLIFSAIWALWHARLLDETRGAQGHVAIFDHLTLNVKGDLLVSWGDLKGGIRAYRQGLRIRPEDINLKNSLGVCLAASGRKTSARELFEQVLDVEPDDFMALYNLAGIYQGMGRLDKAEVIIARALKVAPDDEAANLRLAQIELASGRPEKALEICRRLTESDGRATGTSQVLLRIQAQACLSQGDWPRARDLLKQVLNQGRSDPVSLLSLAQGYLRFEHDPGTAARFFELIKARNSLPADMRKEYDRLSRSLQNS